MDKKKILMIDDDVRFGRMARKVLEETGKYEVKVESDGAEALTAVKKFAPTLVLLDLMIPGTSGVKICKELKERDRFAAIPVIVLSGKQDESDKVAALDAGADDYIEKPFSVHELDARIRAVLRRSGAEGPDEKIEVSGMLVIDSERHEVTVKNKKVELTSAEFNILKLLASKPTHVFTRPRILDYLWEGEKGVTERTIDVHVRHLREKLGKAAKFIVNVRGVGYKFSDEE